MNKLILCLVALVWLAACSSDKVAGGTSEETNTIAGVLYNGQGQPVQGALIEVRSTKQIPMVVLTKTSLDIPVQVHLDTTDAMGRWAVSATEYGQYGIVAKHDSLQSYQTVLYNGNVVETSSTLQSTAPVAGTVRLSGDSLHSPVNVSIPGTPWSVLSDSLGGFQFAALPPGNYSFVIKSPDPERYTASSYYVSWKPGSTPVTLGPLPASQSPESDWDSENDPSAYGNTFDWVLPVTPEYGLQGWWTLDYYKSISGYQEIADARGRSGTLLVYGNVSNVAGHQGSALRFSGSGTFGVIENDRGVLAQAKALSVEAWVYLENNPAVSDSPHNLFGKLASGDDAPLSVFSLALVHGACGSSQTALAMFLTQDSASGLTCNQAVVSATEFPLGQWVHAAAVWNGQSITLYQNGVPVARKAHVLDSLPHQELPVYFGKSNLQFRIDEVRWGTEPLHDQDIFYRYRMFDQTEWAY